VALNFNGTTPAAPTGSTNVVWQNDVSGNVSAYLPTSSSVVASTLNANLTANFNSGTAYTLFTPGSAAAYRISFSQAIVTAATSSSTFPSLTLGWTDVGSVARTATLVSTSTSNATTVESDGVKIIYTNGSTAVTITSASYASSGATSMAYALAVVAELL
jgi:hypothetical protein